MSRRVAGSGCSCTIPAPQDGSSLSTAPRNFPAKEEQERGLILPHFLQDLGSAGLERERLLWGGYRLMLLPSGTVTSPMTKGLLSSLQCLIKKSLL